MSEIDYEKEFEQITIQQLKEEEKTNKELWLLFGAIALLYRNDLFNTVSKATSLSYADLNKYGRMNKIKKDAVKRVKELEKTELKKVDDHLVNAYMKRREETAKLLNITPKPLSRAEALKELRHSWGDEKNPSTMKSYKERIHDNKKKMIEDINKAVKPEQDKDISKMVSGVEKAFESGAKRSQTLLRTEATRATHLADFEMFKEAGVTKVQYNAQFDVNTCVECGQLHTKIFTLGNHIYVPRHPNCKCIYVPIIEPTTTGKR